MSKTYKHDREFHFRFNSLYEVYSFLSDVSDYVKNKEDPIYMEEIMPLYSACPAIVDVRYDNDDKSKQMNFKSLYDVHSFLSYYSVGCIPQRTSTFDDDSIDCPGMSIYMEEIRSLYKDGKDPKDVSYDYDDADKWVVYFDRLQLVYIYKTPKETYLIQNVEFNKGEGYYLVILGMEEIKK